MPTAAPRSSSRFARSLGFVVATGALSFAAVAPRLAPAVRPARPAAPEAAAPPPTCSTTATHFGVSVGALVADLGQYVPVTVTAYDNTPSVVTGYGCTVTFSSSDTTAGATVSSTNPTVTTTLVNPGGYTFVPGDNGTHTFYVQFSTKGVQTVTATDNSGPIAGTSPGTTVSPVLFTSSGTFFQNFAFTGSTAVGSTNPQTVTIQLSGTVTLSSVALATGFTNIGNTTPASADYSLGTPNCSGSNPQTCTLSVTFQPFRPGTRQAPLVVTDTNNNTYYLGLSGLGTGGALAFTPGVIQSVLAFASTQGQAYGTVDSAGNEYIADFNGHRIYQLSSAGTLTALAGTGVSSSGSTTFPNSSPLTAQINGPIAVKSDAAGNLYIADESDNVVLKLDKSSNTLSVVAGVYNSVGLFSGNGGPATSAGLSAPTDVVLDGSGNAFIADSGNHEVREVCAQVTGSGVCSTVAAGAIVDFAGDTAGTTTGVPNFSAAAVGNFLNQPIGLALDSSNNLYVTDKSANAVYEISSSTSPTVNPISLFAGASCSSGSGGSCSGTFSGDGSAATSAAVKSPLWLAVDTAGDVYISDSGNNRVRRVDYNNLTPGGNIHTIAGGGTPSAGIGDNGASTDASLVSPQGVWVDSIGTVYIGDSNNGVTFHDEIRKIAVSLGQVANFKTVLENTTTSAQQLLLTNVGNDNFALSSFTTPSSDYNPSAGAGCTSPLAQGANCTYNVTFTPSVTGADNSTLSGGGATATLTGIGAVVTLTPTSFNFVAPTSSTNSSAQTFTYLNPATNTSASQTITLSAVASTTNPTNFIVGTNTCTNGKTLTPPSASCTASLTFHPGGATTDSLAITAATAGSVTENASSTLTGTVKDINRNYVLTPSSAQSTTIGTAFGTVLSVTVTDSLGTPVVGDLVTFKTPASTLTAPAAGGWFTDTGSNTTTAFTNSSGVATATTLTANNVSSASSYNATITESEDGCGTSTNCSTTVALTNNPLSQSVGSQTSTPITLYFDFSSTELNKTNAAVSDIQVLTDGQANQDFTVVSSNVLSTNCQTGTVYRATNTATFCTIQLNFKPTAPGPRHGSVVIYNGTGLPFAPLATLYFNGTGSGPAMSFNAGSPSASTVFAAGVLSGLSPSTLSNPTSLKLDAAGDIFVADTGNLRVLELPAGASSAVVLASSSNGGLVGPKDMAFDAGGNLYITDNNGSTFQIIKIVRDDGGYATPSTFVATTINNPYGIATDGQGNFYFAEGGSRNRISKFVAGANFNPGGASVNTGGTALVTPEGLVVDATASNLYIADPGQAAGSQLLVMPLTGGSAGTVSVVTLPASMNSATLTGVAIDPAGDLYLSDSTNKEVWFVSANLANASVISGAVTLASGGPGNVSIDGAGNVYFGDTGQATSASTYKLDLQDGPSVAFGSQARATTSSPKGPLVTNIGNTSLTFSSFAITTDSTDFAAVTASGCPTLGGGTLASGNNCTLRATFTPTSALGSLSGVLTATDNALNAAGSTQTLALSGTSIVGTAAKLVFTTEPSNAAQNAANSPAIVVKIEDSANDVITTDNTDTVTLALTTGNGAITGGSTVTVTVTAGVATFSNIAITATGIEDILTASTTAGGFTQTSTAFNITAVPTKLGFTTQPPASTVAGIALASSAPVVSIEDNGNNPVGSGTDSISVTIASGPGSFAVGSTTTVGAVAGAATFSNLIFDTAGTYTLTASDNTNNGYTSATSNSFTIVAAAASKLAITTQPSASYQSGATITVVATLQDQFGNTIQSTDADHADTIALAFGTNTAGGVLAGTTSVAAVNGVATFSAFDVVKVGIGYTVIASDSTHNTITASAASSPFAITPGPATHFTVSAPANTIEGTAFGSVTVTALDASNNTATGYAGTVKLTSTDPGYTAPAPATLTAGVGTFTGNTLIETGPQTITATDTITNTINGTSGAIAVAAISENVGATSATFPVTFTFGGSTTLAASNAVQVLTQGTTGLDYAISGSGSTCIPSFTGTTCSVNVTYTAAAPGIRSGAVTVYDNGGTAHTVYLAGTASSPLINFANSTTTNLFADASASGVAVDANGDVFATSLNGGVQELVHGAGSATAVVTAAAISESFGIAVDGAGNLFISKPSCACIYRVARNSDGSYATPTIFSTAVASPNGLFLDYAGNLFAASDGGAVYEFPVGGGGPITVANTAHAAIVVEPYAITGDAAGNLYVADATSKEVYEIASGAWTNSTPASSVTDLADSGNGLNQPEGVALTPHGDLYVSDQANHAVYFLAAGKTHSNAGNPPPAVVSSIQNKLIATDASGNLYLTNEGAGQISELNLASAPALTYGTVTVNQTSSAQTVTVTNVGTANLNFSALAYASGTNFTSSGNTCSTSAAVTAGTSCTLSLTFAPVVSGSLSDTFNLTDNNLNASSVIQGVAVSGTAAGIGQTINFTLSSPVTYGVSPITLSATGGLSGNPVVFSVVSGPGTVSGTNGQTLTITGAGSIVVAANQAGNTTYAAAGQVTQTLVVNQATLTISGLTAQNKQYDRTTAATVTGTASLVGVVSGDTVNLGGAGTFTFASAGVGTGIAVSGVGYTISGSSSANYTLTQPGAGLSANITAAPLTITGLTANNKQYDRTTAATVTGTATLSGVISGDTVNLGGSGTYTFASANVGTGIAVSGSGFTLSGTQAGNYSLTQPGAGLSANITAAPLTITGLTANNKQYDRTTTATVSGTAALSGVISGDTVNLGGSATFTFASANVGTGISVSGSGYTLSGGQAGNYSLTQPGTGLSANITARPLTISGISIATKPYDGTNAATISGSAVLVGVISPDVVTLGGTPVATFNSTGAGFGIATTVSGYALGGAAQANYSLTQPSGLTGTISQLPVTITGLTASNKTYDATATATLTGTPILSGVLAADSANVTLVTSGASATFVSSNVGTGIAITGFGYTLSGSAAGNYSLSQPGTGLSANITPRALTITGLSANNKAYDATTTATLTGTPTLSGVLFPNTVSLVSTGATAAFASANVGTAIAVSGSGYSITGSAAANYSLTQPGSGLSANITAKALTITGLTANSKVFDGTTATTLSGTAALSGVISGDTVSLGGTPTATFATSAVGTGIAVTVTGYTISGASAGNYTLTQPQGLTANITAPSTSTLTLSTAGLTFGSQVVNTTSSALTVTVTNNGPAAAVFTAVAASGDFAETNNCATLAVNASCSVNVTFTPTVLGARGGSLTFTDNASGNPQSVTLNGTGTAPGVIVTPPALIFGSQVVTTTSTGQSVTIENTGTATLTVSSVTASGDFAVSGSNCAVIPAGSSCSVSVIFTPTATGTRTGTLTVTDNGGSGIQTVSLTGNGTVAGVSLTPSSLTFATTVVGTSSSTLTALLTNTGTVTLTGIAISSQGDFTQTNTCAAALAGGANCTITVTFKPSLAGAESGSVIVNDSLGQQIVALAGTGVAPGISLSNGQLIFGGQLVGTQSQAQTVSITNSGSTSLTITSITPSAQFGDTTNCGTSLAAGATCTINVFFSPTAVGVQTGTVTVVDSVGTQTVTTIGQGQNPGLELIPSFAIFGGQIVGTSSLSQTLTLVNNGTATLTLGPRVTSSDFSETDACPTTLTPGASCLVSVTFAPTALGNRQGALTVSDTANISTGLATLSGQGTLPGLLIFPSTLSFGSLGVGSTSLAQTVTVENNGTAPIAIASIITSGDFAETDNCNGQTLSPGALCVLNVTMTPTTTGSRTGTITITDSSAGTHPIALSGLGQSTGIDIYPQALAFGSLPIPIPGAQITLSGTQLSVTVTNLGSTTVTFSGFQVSGDFTESDNCSTSLAPAARCTMTINFIPTALGNRTGNLLINDNLGQQVVSLDGFGSPGGLTLTPPVLNFGVQTVGVTSSSQKALLTNQTGQNITGMTIVPSGEYNESDACGSALANGASCTLNISITPVAVGAITGTVTVNGTLGPIAPPLPGDAARVNPDAGASNTFSLGVVALTATANPPGVGLSAPELSFSLTAVGTASTGQTLTLTNTGTGLPLTGLIFTSSPEFPFTTNCPTTLAHGQSCTITVTFLPAGAGLRTGFLTIFADGGIEVPVPENGIGLGPQLTIAPNTLAYAARGVASVSATQTLLLQNTGAQPLHITAASFSGTEYAFAGGTCVLPQTLAVGATCTALVTFQPAAQGTRNGTLTYVSDSGSGNAIVTLQGAGSAPDPALSALGLAFGTQGVGVSSAGKTITVTNTGSAALTLGTIVAAGDYTQTNNCPASLAAGATCTITVIFKPTAYGTRNSTLTINSSTGTQVVALTGAGSDFAITWAGTAPSAVTLNAGQTTTYSLGLNSLSGDAQTIGLSCVTDTGFSCTLNPASVAINPAGTFTLTLKNTTASAVPPVGGSPNWPLPRSPLSYGMLVVVLLTAYTLRQRKRLGLTLAGASMLLMSAACGGAVSTPSNQSPLPSTHTFTITAVSSTNATHSITLNLVVE